MEDTRFQIFKRSLMIGNVHRCVWLAMSFLFIAFNANAQQSDINANAIDSRKVVYESNLKEAESQWINGVRKRTPRREWVIRPDKDQRATFKLNQPLPKHEQLTIKVTIRIKGGWTGNTIRGRRGLVIGPNHWGFSVNGKQHPVFTTFSNTPFHKQAYPANVGMALDPGEGSSRLAKHIDTSAEVDIAIVKDHVYIIERTIPHNSSALTLDFFSIGLDTGLERSWEILDLQLSVAPQFQREKINREDFETLLNTLMNELPVEDEKVQTALKQFQRLDPSVLAWLDIQQQDILTADDIQALIQGIESNERSTRDKATTKLREQGPAIHDQLREAAEKAETLEGRDRILKILNQPVANHNQLHHGKFRLARALRSMNLKQADQLARVYEQNTLANLGQLRVGSAWRGWCAQSLMANHSMVMWLDKKDGKEVHGRFVWPSLRNSLTKFKGQLDGDLLQVTEYELVRGSNIIIPVDYQLRFINGHIYGQWIAGPNNEHWGTIYLAAEHKNAPE